MRKIILTNTSIQLIDDNLNVSKMYGKGSLYFKISDNAVYFYNVSNDLPKEVFITSLPVNINGIEYDTIDKVTIQLSNFFNQGGGGGGTSPEPMIFQEKIKNIDSNGTYNVVADEGYNALAKVIANVNVPEPNYQNKEIIITKNQELTITADQEYDGIESLKLKINVPIEPGDTYFIQDDEWSEFPLPEILRNSTQIYTYLHKNNLYISSNAANAGIWRFNLIDHTLMPVYHEGYVWAQWYIFNDNLFVSSNTDTSANRGILYLNDDNIFIKVYSLGISWINGYVTQNNNLVLSPSNTSAGMVYWNSELKIFEQLKNSGYGWTTFYEISNTETLVSGTSQYSSGIWILKEENNTITFTELHADASYNWSFCTFKNEVFAGTSSHTGVGRGALKLNSNHTAFDLITTEIQYAVNWFVTPNNQLLVSSTHPSYSGLWKWNGTEFIKVITTDYNFINWYVTPQGKIILSGAGISNGGIWMSKDDENEIWTRIYNVGYNWKYFISNTNNEVFISSETSSNSGLLKIVETDNDLILNQVFTSGYRYDSLTEIDGITLIYSSIAATHLLRWHPSTNTMVSLIGSRLSVKFYKTKNGTNLISFLNGIGLYKFDQDLTILTGIQTSGTGWINWITSSNGDEYVSSFTPASSNNFGLYKFIPENNTMALISSEGYNYKLMNNDLAVSSDLTSIIRFPIIDLSKDKQLDIRINGEIIDDWVLFFDMFVKIDSKYPLKAFRPSGKITTFNVITNDDYILQLTSNSILYKERK